MKRINLVPYKMGSKSVKLLKEALNEAGIKTYRNMRPSLASRVGTLTIYYGGAEKVSTQGKELNRERGCASNKLTTFQALTASNISCVPWTVSREEAQAWQSTVVVRSTLTGHSGQGITIVENGEDLPVAPLYTKYVKKSMECRLHVFNGQVIDAQVKRKRRDLPEGQEADTKVRNHHTGWVYCRDGFTPDDTCKELAKAATDAVGLDFGAVDIIFNQHYNTYYVLEVNTAPGLEGTTLANYVKEIVNVFKAN